MAEFMYVHVCMCVCSYLLYKFKIKNSHINKTKAINKQK